VVWLGAFPYRLLSSNATSLGFLVGVLVSEGKLQQAEPLAQEALEFRQKHDPDSWPAFGEWVLLGESQRKYIEAESLLLSGYEGMEQRKDKIPSWAGGDYRRQPRLKKALELLVQR